MKKPRASAKPSRRSKAKYPALQKGMNLKTRTNLIDYDYLDKLGPAELDYLNRFTEEFINASMNHPGKKLHKTKKLQKDCYTRNNARNRDILTRAQASGASDYLEEIFANEADYEQYLRENTDDAAGSEENSED